MTTIDPLHDYVDPQSTARVKDHICECPACTHAGVDHPPVIELEKRTVEGRTVTIGRYLHGAELRMHLAERKRLLDDLKRQIAGHALVEC
jgi:hypothetical protein